MNKIFRVLILYLFILLLTSCLRNEQVRSSPGLNVKEKTGGTIMTQNISPVISAEALLKSRSGRSMTEGNIAITAENVEEFSPTPQVVAEATKRLQELGFTVSQGGVTLTLQGQSTQFEKVFGSKLNLETDESTGNITVQSESDLIIPESLKEVVEQVVFPEPPQFFP